MVRQRWVRLSIAFLASAVVFAVCVHHGLRMRLYHDLWPLDRSPVGPNLMASMIQWFVVAVVASILYPPIKWWANRELDQIHAKIDHIAEQTDIEMPDHLKGRPGKGGTNGEEARN